MKNKLLLTLLLLAFLANSASGFAQTTTLVGWNFDATSVNATTFNSNNSGKQLTSSQTIGWNADDNSGQAASAEGWNNGAGSDYWQIEVNTTGFETLKVSSWQKGSNSGPANFKIQYRVGSTGSFIDVTGATVTMTNSNWAAYGKLTDALIPTEADNTSVVFIRWLMVNNTGIGGSNVQSGGNSRIDDIIITGTPACIIPATPSGTAAVSNNPSCGPATLTYNQTAPAGATFYWQTTATGTATTSVVTASKSITTTTTATAQRYIRAKNNSGNCWSAALDTGIGTITIKAAPSISVQPVNKSVALGAVNTQFSTTVTTPTGTILKWQVSSNNGQNWTDLSNTAPYSGTATSVLTIATATVDIHNNQYRLVATNTPCTTAISNPALFIITGTPTISMQPNLTYTYCNSAKIEMAAVNALGTQDGLSYNWFVFTPGSNDWTPVANDGHYSGADTPVLYLNSLVGLNRSQYYVQVRYKNQSCYTATKAVGVVVAEVLTRWDGTGWSNGAPNTTTVAVLDADYNTDASNLTACSIDLNDKTITINENQFVQVENAIAGTGTIDIKNNGSLVQKQDNVNNGRQWTTKMERITQKMYRYDFTYWSSPVTGTTLNYLSPNTLYDKYYWWNSGTLPGAIGWTISYNGSEEMVPGKGYTVRAPQMDSYGTNPALPSSYHPYTGNFIGKTNNGSIRYEVAGGVDVYNLIGNPYPSAIDADKFITDNIANGSINGTLYFWTHNTPIDSGYSASDYAAYTIAGGVGTNEASSDPDNTNDNSPRGQITAGQAFFVEGNTTNGSVVFSNTMRTTGPNHQFFKPAPTEPIESWEMTGKHRIWLNLKNSGTGFNQILLGYMQYATNGNDMGYDGKSFSGNQVTLYSINENENLTIQARALPFNNQDQVPLGYNTALTGTLVISIDHYDGLFEAQNVYLEDKLLNTVHNLKESAYSFSSAAGTFNDRFVVKYVNTTLGGEEHEAAANEIIVYKNTGALHIKSELENLQQVTIYDLLGRTIWDKAAIGQHELSIQNVVMNEQTLIVKVQLENGIVVSKKVMY